MRHVISVFKAAVCVFPTLPAPPGQNLGLHGKKIKTLKKKKETLKSASVEKEKKNKYGFQPPPPQGRKLTCCGPFCNSHKLGPALRGSRGEHPDCSTTSTVTASDQGELNPELKPVLTQMAAFVWGFFPPPNTRRSTLASWGGDETLC